MISFGAPHWFWALSILPILAFFYSRAERNRTAQLREFISPRLLAELAGNVDRRRRALRFACVLLSIALAVTTLAKPRRGYVYEDVKRRGLDLLLAIDTSRSMLSNDVSPNRLERVKLATQDLLNDLQGDRVGLIAFAGRAFLQAPLTIDYDAVVESINDLDTKTIPEGGTNISEAIALAVQTLGKSATGNRALVVFTDGEELSGDAVKEAKAAADEGIRIFTIGVGTAQGSLIPIEDENGAAFVKDAKGQVVKSRLDEKRLEEIASATSGMYLHLENGPQTMRRLMQEGLTKMKAAEFDARPARRPIERYQWPLGAAVLALVASLFISDRKRERARVLPSPSSAAKSALVAGAASLLATAQLFGASGLDLYQQGKYDDAYAHFREDLQRNLNPADTPKMEFDAGAAAFKLKQYDKALEAFSRSLVDPSLKMQELSHYNLGKTLEDRADLQKTKEDSIRDLENAAQHYEQTLKINPKNEDAAKALRDVLDKIARLKKKPKPTPTPTPPPPQNQKNKNNNQQDQQQQNQNSQSNQQQKNNQQQQKSDQEQKNDQSQNQQKSEQQKSGNGKSEEKNEGQNGSHNNQSEQKNSEQKGGPTPTPSPSRGSSPSPSPGPGTQPSASPGEKAPGENGSPTPTPGERSEKQGNEGGGSPSPAPSASPITPREGEIKGLNESNEKEKAAAQAEAEAEKRGELSPKQAERLLRSMKNEEAHVQLDEHKLTRPVYNDW